MVLFGINSANPMRTFRDFIDNVESETNRASGTDTDRHVCIPAARRRGKLAAAAPPGRPRSPLTGDRDDNSALTAALAVVELGG